MSETTGPPAGDTAPEVEAVARALHDGAGGAYTCGNCIRTAEKAIAALDRVRADSARDEDDPASPGYDERMARLMGARDEDHEAIKDLRGVECREVHRDDAVIIDGAEYLRKSRLARQAEFGPSPVDDTVRLREALTELCRWAKAARGHYGIEECAGPGKPATEWDEIQDGLRAAAMFGRAALSADAGKPEANDG